MIFGYAGEKGDYAYMALNRYLGKHNLTDKVEVRDYKGSVQLLDALKENEIDKAIILTGDTLRGRVEKSFDYLYERALFVNGEIKLPVQLALVSCGDESRIKKVIVTSQSLNYITEHIQALSKRSQIEVEVVESNREIDCMEKSEKGDESAAVIMADSLDSKSSLTIIDNDFADKRGNNEILLNFFIISSNPYVPAEAKGRACNALVAITPHNDRPGLLRDLSSVISIYKVNMTDIFSRPAIEAGPDKTDAKMFYIIMEGHIMSDIFQTHILPGIKAILQHSENRQSFRFLGCYEADR